MIENNNIIINDGDNFQEETMMMEMDRDENCYNDNDFIRNSTTHTTTTTTTTTTINTDNNGNPIKSEIFKDFLNKLDSASKEIDSTRNKLYPKIELENKIFNNGFKPNPKYDQVNCKVVKEIDPFRINEEIELLPSSYGFKKYIKLKLNSLLHCSKSQPDDFEQTFERIFDVNSTWNDKLHSQEQLQLQQQQSIFNNLDTLSQSSITSSSTSTSTTSTISSVVHLYDQNTTNSIAEEIILKKKKKKVSIVIEKMIFVKRNGVYSFMYGSYKRNKNLTLIGFFPISFNRRSNDQLISILTNYLYHGRNLINQEFEILTNLIKIKNVNICSGGGGNGNS